MNQQSLRSLALTCSSLILAVMVTIAKPGLLSAQTTNVATSKDKKDKKGKSKDKRKSKSKAQKTKDKNKVKWTSLFDGKKLGNLYWHQ